MTKYELHALKLPKMSGLALKIFTSIVENPIGKALLINSLLENGGIPKLRTINLVETPTMFPIMESTRKEDKVVDSFQPSVMDNLPGKESSKKIRNNYLSKQASVPQIAEKVLANIRLSESIPIPLKAFASVMEEDVLKQAEESQKRYDQGIPLSLLDGVPVAIKDEVDMVPHPTTVGTAFLGKHPAQQDSTVVSRLRAAGALLVGKTNMHEIGINPNGANITFGAVKNPYDLARDPGGSSSGSAAAVSAGIVPIAIGADGGGSIRIPAGLCGIVGLKATYGRISEFGAAPLCWSVAHLGPLATTVEDAALAYTIIAGPDPKDPNTQKQPPLTMKNWNKTDLSGMKMGIYREWFDHASAEIVESCYTMLDRMQQMGARVVEIEIPELDEMRIAHAMTILSEMALCMKPYKKERKLQGPAVRLSLVLGEVLTSSDYLQAQRMRTRAISIFGEQFQKVDCILTPGTALTAQPIPKGGEKTGWSDLSTDTEMMRFIYPGNLTGLPSITFPIGYDSNGLPISMQAIGRYWEENVLFQVAYNAERALKFQLPKTHYEMLQ